MTPDPANQGVLSWLWSGGSAIVAAIGMLFGAALGIGAQRGTIHAHEQRLNALDIGMHRLEDDVRYEIRKLRDTVEANQRQIVELLNEMRNP